MLVTICGSHYAFSFSKMALTSGLKSLTSNYEPIFSSAMFFRCSKCQSKILSAYKIDHLIFKNILDIKHGFKNYPYSFFAKIFLV